MNTKRWRKAAGLAVAGVMTLSMGACGGDGGGSPQSDQVIINSVMNSSSQASLNYNPFSPTALSGVVGVVRDEHAGVVLRQLQSDFGRCGLLRRFCMP